MQKLYVVLWHWGTWKMLILEPRRSRRLFIVVRSEEVLILKQQAVQATHAGDLKAVADALEDQWF